jgi:hypothetical protein
MGAFGLLNGGCSGANLMRSGRDTKTDDIHRGEYHVKVFFHVDFSQRYAHVLFA